MPLPCHPSLTGSPSRQSGPGRGEGSSCAPPRSQSHSTTKAGPRVRHCHQPVPPSSHPVSQKQHAPRLARRQCLQQAQSLSHLGASAHASLSACYVLLPFLLRKVHYSLHGSLRAQLSEAFHNKPRRNNCSSCIFPCEQHICWFGCPSILWPPQRADTDPITKPVPSKQETGTR